MKVLVNNLPVTLSPPAHLATLLAHLNHSPDGTALAVNQVIIPRSHWAKYQLNEGDDILLFQAIAGG
ncbi:sulfur carrier protein ThiS [Biostraticola tofi]|uniref:Sulfur carrier protein ThiS n=1 Tax=Biostraticola tofi TaxID=466109 RepID=A0A4R3YHF4_9GAMM|nr:sulfur carrier protein ThiS [Biostraticola tofi]TCV91491.1 sulfur carrier protein ThiS [Biostraticola tofi]